MSNRVVLGFEASSALGPRTGVGVYTAELLSALPEALPSGWEVKALAASWRYRPPKGDRWSVNPRIHVRQSRVPGRYLLRSWEAFRAPRVERFLGRVDLMHSPASWPVPTRAPLVLSVHDLFFLKELGPEDSLGGSYFARTWPRVLPHSEIIVFSQAVAEQVAAHYPIDPPRIHVIPHGYRALRKKEKGGERPKDPLILAVGTIGPRKNYETLLRAFAQVRGTPRLVIVGHQPDAVRVEALRRLASELGCGGRIRLAGYVCESELSALYHQASVFCMISNEEGFGLPLLEAFDHGAPVLCSDLPIFREIAGDAAVYTDAQNPEAVAKALIDLLGAPGEQERLREAGRQRLPLFTWQRSAKATVQVYRRVLSRSRR